MGVDQLTEDLHGEREDQRMRVDPRVRKEDQEAELQKEETF